MTEDLDSVKALCCNFPAVDVYMVTGYLQRTKGSIGPDTDAMRLIRPDGGVKGDFAVRNVEVKREGDRCRLKCTIVPSDEVDGRGYSVLCTVNEMASLIESVSCEDCALECGHPALLLSWLLQRKKKRNSRRRQKRSRGSGAQETFAEGKGGCMSEVEEGAFLESFRRKAAVVGPSLTPLPPISMREMLMGYKSNGGKQDPNEFLQYCSRLMDRKRCQEVLHETALQSQCHLWFEMRYGRVTASTVFQATKGNAHSLVGSLLGECNSWKSEPESRGVQLETMVLKVVEAKYSTKIQKCGLYLSCQYPWLGASPDGICDRFVVEVKCPMTANSMVRYTANGMGAVPSAKFFSQIQLQMLMAGKKKALFCIADWDFERNRKVSVLEVGFNKCYCDNMLEKAKIFWTTHVFPIMYQSL